MKKLAFLLALLMTVSAFVFPVGAASSDVLMIDSFDTAKLLNCTADNTNQVEGAGCNTYTFPDTCTGATVQFRETLATPVDLTDYNYVGFWFYVSDMAKITKDNGYVGGYVELSSAGSPDANRIKFNPQGGNFKNFIYGTPQDGWNFFYLDIRNSTATAGPGYIAGGDNGFDYSAMNYFRLYVVDKHSTTATRNLDGVTFKFDSLMALKDLADIPPIGTQEGDVLTMDSLDTAKLLNCTVDTLNQVEGDGCNTYTFPDTCTGATVQFRETLATPVDLTDYNYVGFWFFVSNMDKITKDNAVSGGYVALSSANNPDSHYLRYNHQGGNFKNFILGTPHDGWNFFYLDIRNATSSDHKAGIEKTDGLFDYSSVNYFRFYTLDKHSTATRNFDGVTVKFDNLVALKDLADVPACPNLLANVTAASLTLNGQIGLNVKLAPSADLIADPAAYVEMNWAGAEGEGQKILLKDAPVTSGEYAFTFEVPAKKIADDVTVKVFSGEGKLATLTLGSAKKMVENNVFTYSVEDYLNVAKDDSDAKLAALASSLLDYSAAARLYFDYNADGAVISDAIAAVDADALASFEKDLTSADVEGIRFFSASLSLDDLVSIKVKLDAADGIDAYTFTCDGSSVTPVLEGGKYVIVFSDIYAGNFDEMHVFTVSDGANTQTLRYGALSYAASKLSGDAAISSLVKALYLYNAAAEAYAA